VSTAFLDLYVKGDAAAGRRLAALGSAPGLATLQIDR
jgi:hypothetical protein